MSRARDVANLGSDTTNLEDISSAYNAGALSNRNKIINGAMQVAQRGTSVSGSTGFYALDRWRGYSTSSFSITQETFTLGQTDVPNEPKNYLRVGAGAAVKALSQRIEDVRTGAGQTLTLSFYAKASAAFDLVMGYTQYFGSGGSAGVSANFGTLSITTSWQKFEVTFTLPSISGKTIGAGDYLQISFADGGTYIPAATTFDITLVQLEVGDTATPFEHRSYGQELALCQRYFEKVTGTCWLLTVRSADDIRRNNISFAVTKRASPSIVITSQVLDGASSISGSANVSVANFDPTGHSTSSAPYVTEFTADAEL